MKLKFILLLVGGFCLTNLPAPLTLRAQTARTLDLTRMQRDVEIMEMVLDRLLNREAGRFMRLGTTSARGTYVPNFGVLFQIPNSSPFVAVYEMQERAGRALVQKKAAGGGRNATTVKPTANAADLNEELWEFFSRYADAIGQLSDQDRIAIFSEGGSEFSFFFEISGEEASGFASQPSNFFAWIYKGDIAALRAGKLSENEFRNRMHMIEHVADNADIEIMSGILDKLTSTRTGTAHGLYLQDYGVIFFTEANFTHNFAHPAWRGRATEATPAPQAEAYRQIEEELRAARTVDAEREKNWQEEYKKFRNRVAEAFADYGHTLRSLKPEDWLVVTTDFHYAPAHQPQGLVCQVKKQQVDLFNSGKISREQLLKSVAFFEN